MPGWGGSARTGWARRSRQMPRRDKREAHLLLAVTERANTRRPREWLAPAQP
jgi:hypothetical protein